MQLHSSEQTLFYLLVFEFMWERDSLESGGRHKAL